MKKKSQQGVALIWMIVAGALLITSVGVVASRKVSPMPTPQPETDRPLDETSFPSSTLQPTPRPEETLPEEPLLKILPPKERAELEGAIREAQQVLQNIEVFEFTPPSPENIGKSLEQINKQAQEQIQKNMEKRKQEFQPTDPKKIEEYFNQNPPAVPQEGKEFSPAEKEYYYRKNILKDPAFQY